VTKRHSEFCYIPKCKNDKDQEWFAVRCLDYTAREAKAKFMEGDTLPWDHLRKEGWRIVKIKVSEIKP
jgi:hypothetical protein